MIGAVALLASLLLPGCLLDEAAYRTRLAALTDDDGDGFHDVAGDCDDENAAVSPGAAEVCNGFDDNCDGDVDELSPTNDRVWGADADGDGYAPPSATAYPSCENPGAGWVSEWGDCDDTADTVYPDAPEACDGADNDCDGAADEEPTADPLTWLHDDDGDGYGAVGSEVVQCRAPAEDWTLTGGDCDDARPEVHPGADERCDGVDDDCDGAADDPPVVGDAGWYADLDSDGFGDASATACVASDGYVDVAGDCDDTDPTVNPTGTEVCNDGKDNDCDGGPGACVWESEIYMPDEHTILPTRSEEGLGYEGAAGDLDGDGDLEFAVSAILGWSPELNLQTGYVAIFSNVIASDTSANAADWLFAGGEDHGGGGASIVIEDLDADGQVDLLVGEPGRTIDGISSAGALYVVYGPLDPSATGTLESIASSTLVGGEQDESVGDHTYALGDLNGDGLADFGTGYEWFARSGTYNSGIAYIFTDRPIGTEVASELATALIYGEEDDEVSQDGAGMDLDGDGLSDVVLGVPGYDTGSADGAAVVFFGPVSGTLSAHSADVVLYAEAANTLAGQSVDPAGDVNDDGLDDLLVGAPQAGDGTAYLLWGSASLDNRSLGDAEVTFRGAGADGHMGYVVRGLGDLNDDSFEDFFFSEGPTNSSSAYVFFGPFDAPGTHRTADADITLTADRYDGIYTTAFSPGDATGDGVADLLVGSYTRGTDTIDGAVFVLDGTGL